MFGVVHKKRMKKYCANKYCRYYKTFMKAKCNIVKRTSWVPNY